jgi:GxxExxY protein
MADITSQALNGLTSTIIESAIRIHRALGPGLLESAYSGCLSHELTKASLVVERQKPLPLTYGGFSTDCAYRADIVVNGCVIVEVKAVDAFAPIHRRQLYTYLRLADCRVGLLLNFGAAVLRDGIQRVVNEFTERRGSGGR